MSIQPEPIDVRQAAVSGGLPRLPSGRHQLTVEEVLASQQGRLLFALFDALTEKGYPATTIADVVTRAGVSRRTFYEHFASKQACFAAAFTMAEEFIVSNLDSAVSDLAEGDWRSFVEVPLRTYLETLAAHPTAAWGLVVETLNAGPEIYEQRVRMQSTFAHRMGQAYELTRRPGGPPWPRSDDSLFEVLVAGIDGQVYHCIRTRGAAALPDLLPGLVAATLAMFGTRPS
ncbi:TetR/AcrR family transcriptional regulator [Nocardioides speluncae]|uniref:TetR/AcrR family transcriptional regulator n=1 Tax=Nocardioides speluncae TaxID=2670337 RepID=UPI0019800ED7|nr:TetR/AcrR family transcriptional regulator [Nocardioides speluncae]